MKFHIHRYRKLGRFGEAKVCLKCGKATMNPEEFYKSKIMALSARAIGQTFEIFNEEEMALLRAHSHGSPTA